MKITVTVDLDKQTSTPEFDSKEFRSWDFVIAMLQQATEAAIFNRDVRRQEAMMQLQMQAAQDQQIKRSLLMRQ